MNIKRELVIGGPAFASSLSLLWTDAWDRSPAQVGFSKGVKLIDLNLFLSVALLLLVLPQFHPGNLIEITLA